MPGGLAATFEVLAATPNEAAVPVLVAALSSSFIAWLFSAVFLVRLP